jgi:hypothetical protein
VSAADYTEQARELLRSLHCWRLLYHDARPIDDPDVGQIAAVLSAVAIRAFGKGVWSDTEEVAYQAGSTDEHAAMLARLQEQDMREAVIEALRKSRWPSVEKLSPLDDLAPGIRKMYERDADAAIAVIKGMLK